MVVSFVAIIFGRINLFKSFRPSFAIYSPEFAPGDVGEQIYKPLTLKKFGVLSNLKHIWEYGGYYRLANILL
jgi:hypothetical protein